MFLPGNQLSGEIPESIGNLINLNSLILYNNQITGEIPYQIGNLINMNFLYLNDNQLTGEIPFEICDIGDPMPSLFNNRLCPPYPDCISQSNIDSFETSECYNQCNGCNVIFNNCDQSVLDFNDCSEIDINVLNDIIQSNDLDEDYATLGYQEWENGRLKSIILLNNDIHQIPDSFGNLLFLEGLDLEYNELTSLPDSFGQLINLKYLDLSSNQLEYLPDIFFDLTNLITLGLYNNSLQSIQDQIGLLSNLNFINLSYNELSSVPEDICNLQNLIWSDSWLGLDYSYLYNNRICPPYPDCIEEYIGYQDTSECIFCEDGYINDCNDNGDCCPESWIDDGWCDDGELSTACNLMCYDEELSDCAQCPDSIEGDANYNGYVNISDIIVMVSCVLEDNCDLCLDINLDGYIDIIDITITVDIILN